MPQPDRRARVLLSVSDKTGLGPFARGLAARGYELVSTGGTASALASGGLRVTAVSDVTGFPEMMDGRVKTLHPRIHAGILARRSRPDDMQSLASHDIVPIDLVVVNLYPFAKAAADSSTPFDGLIEEIDIGGPSLVRAAAKNFEHVLVVVSPEDYDRVLAELGREGGPTRDFRFALARKAFAHTAAYDAGIAETLSAIDSTETGFVRGGTPSVLGTVVHKVCDLRYGENPHQRAAWYRTDPPAGFGASRVLQGKALSFTNLLDLDAAVRLIAEFDEPAAVVIKHTNPCGAATGTSAADAYIRARDADALAAFGGIVGLNRAIDAAAARALTSTFIEAVVAPGVTREAESILATKTNLRVVTMTREAIAAAPRSEWRSILGSVLVQDCDAVTEAATSWADGASSSKVVTKRSPTGEEWAALRFAWRVCAHVKSNAVIFTDAERTMAIGAGQSSRVEAVKVAVLKAGERGVRLEGTVAASDAYFPFRDGLDAIAAAGATAVAQPGGSVRDGEVIAAADEHGIAMVFTGRRHFRH
jgi:phosphoribosylaminoimidazolecarboxamide formyltransferase / IMP cyclohydrolase